MDGVRRRLARGLVRGTVAAMAMTGVRQVTTGLGLVEQTPPDAIIKQRAPGLLVRMPRLAFFVAKRQAALVELAHWFYGAGGGAAFAMLPDSVRRRSVWAGIGYGLFTTLVFELGIVPILGLDKFKKIRPIEQLMFTADHLLYGLILAEGEKRALPEKRGRWLR
jgi:uncharacterized membrane protein YagU involved in acid resistance